MHPLLILLVFTVILMTAALPLATAWFVARDRPRTSDTRACARLLDEAAAEADRLIASYRAEAFRHARSIHITFQEISNDYAPPH